MADICSVAVLPEYVRTVQQALDNLAPLKVHAYATVRGKTRVIHARDLLRAQDDGIESIGEVQGMSLAPLPKKVVLDIQKKFKGFDGLAESLRRGEGEDAVYPVFAETDADFLLAAVQGSLAVLVSRHEGFAASVNAGACVCDGTPRHFYDSPPAGSGKPCAKAGCPGTYRCY